MTENFLCTPLFLRGESTTKDVNCSLATTTYEKMFKLLIWNDLGTEIPPFEKGGCRGDFIISLRKVAHV